MIHQIFVFPFKFMRSPQITGHKCLHQLDESRGPFEKQGRWYSVMETTFNSAILKHDGNNHILIDENDKIENKSKERMVSLYTDHDMVINSFYKHYS
jgi:hypothetical protein